MRYKELRYDAVAEEERAGLGLGLARVRVRVKGQGLHVKGCELRGYRLGFRPESSQATT